MKTNNFFWNLNNHFVHLNEGWRMLARRSQVKKHGFCRMGTKWDEICKNIIKECYKNDHYVTSTGHFNEVYIRDFAWCAEPLVRLGHKKQVISTSEYILQTFKQYGRVGTTIDPLGTVFDFPIAGPDSFAYLTKILTKQQMKENKSFIEAQTRIYIQKFLDENGLIKKKLHTTSIKDHAIRSSSCYDNCMSAMLQKNLRNAGIKSELDQYNYKKLIKENYWAGEYFKDDSQNNVCSADANIFPFWCKIFNDKAMIRKSVAAISKNKLDYPFPMRFLPEGKTYKMIFEAMFARRYELDTYWTHMAPMYIDIVAKVNKKKAISLADRYKSLIEYHGTYPEVLEANGEPYKNAFYICDEGMLWAAMFYEVVKRNKL